MSPSLSPTKVSVCCSLCLLTVTCASISVSVQQAVLFSSKKDLPNRGFSESRAMVIRRVRGHVCASVSAFHRSKAPKHRGVPYPSVTLPLTCICPPSPLPKRPQLIMRPLSDVREPQFIRPSVLGLVPLLFSSSEYGVILYAPCNIHCWALAAYMYASIFSRHHSTAHHYLLLPTACY